MDIEQYVELDVIEERVNRKHLVFEDEVYSNLLEDIVEFSHHFYSK